MSNVWIIKEEDLDNGDVEESVWTTLQAARKEAVARIQDLIQSRWDLSDSDIRDVAVNINGAIISGDYLKAISYFNDEEANRNAPYYISVYDRILHDYNDASDPEILDYNEDEDEIGDDDDDDDDDDDEPVSSGPFVATSPGAVCRGPCGNYSPDAYANRRDGTYECYQCKFMKGIFGS